MRRELSRREDLLMSEQVLKRLQGVLSEAMEERRGLVVYSRLEAIEMDRLARRVERETLKKLRGLLPADTEDQRMLGVRNRLQRMQDELEELGEQAEIREHSRQMQADDIVWQAFEDIAWMLGIE